MRLTRSPRRLAVIASLLLLLLGGASAPDVGAPSGATRTMLPHQPTPTSVIGSAGVSSTPRPRRDERTTAGRARVPEHAVGASTFRDGSPRASADPRPLTDPMGAVNRGIDAHVLDGKPVMPDAVSGTPAASPTPPAVNRTPPIQVTPTAIGASTPVSSTPGGVDATPPATLKPGWRKAASNPAAVSAWLTTSDGKSQLARQPDIRWGPEGAYTPLTIWVDDTQRYQRIRGFGGSMTDTSAWLLYHVLKPDQRAAVMKALFSPTVGIGVDFLRQSMGASDFTHDRKPYSYDDRPAGTSDPLLAHFSIRHDEDAIIPALRAALRLNPDLSILANPWSPPPWMRRDGRMTGSMDPNPLRPDAYAPLAAYFVHFIQAYQAHGIPIEAIGPQNEPGFGYPDYPAMALPSDNESTLIKDIATELRAHNLHTRIVGYDWVWGGHDITFGYPFSILRDKTSGPLIDGISFHCYFGEPDVMNELHALYPDKEIDETECSDFAPATPFYASRPPIEMVINALRNWSATAGLWNIAVATTYGPAIGHGCTTCIGLVNIDRKTKKVSYTRDYYQLGQASAFVRAGATRIGSNTFGSSAYNAPGANVTRSLEDVAFQNPDGSHVLVVENAARTIARFKVRWGAQTFSYRLSPGAIVTFTWRGAISPSPAIPASPPGPVYYAIDAGGPGGGKILPDTFYDQGRAMRVGVKIQRAPGDSAPESLYRSERFGLMPWQYTFPALHPGVLYGIRLHFAELAFRAPGQRQFDIFINGVRVARNFDIVRAADGPDRAIVVGFVAPARRDGTIAVRFTSGAASYPVVNGIDIVAPSLLSHSAARLLDKPTAVRAPGATAPRYVCVRRRLTACD